MATKIHYTDINSTALAFLRYGVDGISPDPISGNLVACLLSRQKVGAVVMNACRSAASHPGFGSLAEKMIGKGIPIVIGMSFDVIASSVEQFLYTLYDSHLRRGLNLPTACHAARLMLEEHRDKITKYGSTINIVDTFVPVCIVGKPCSVEAYPILENKRLVDVSRDKKTGLAPAESDLFGRENDLLLIETNLLWSSHSVVLWGPAGIGKTALCAYICHWWSRTGVVDEVAWVQLASCHRSLIPWPGLAQAVAQSLNLDSSSSWDSILQHLAAQRYCLCVDSLESMALLDSKARLTLRRDIKYLVRNAASNNTILLFTSRREESWISPHTYVHTVKGMSLAATMQYINAEAKQLGFTMPYSSPEQLHYLERVVILLDYNPLAIHAVLRKLGSGDFRMLYYRLMSGNSVLDDVSWAEGHLEYRSVIDLSNLISALDHVHIHEYNVSDTYTEASISSVDAQRTFTTIRENSSSYDLMDVLVPPCHLGLFWNKVPAEGFAQYILFSELEMHGFQQMANKLAAYPLDEQVTGVIKIILKPFLDFADRMLLSMQALGLISACYDSVPSSDTGMSYQIHPLVTLLARQSVVFKLHSNKFIRAFVKYNGYRLQKWPWKYEYGNAVWQPYLQQASSEFSSHLAALILAFVIGYRTFWTHVVFKRLVFSVQKSLVNSLENQFIVVDVWQRIRDTMLEFPLECFYQRNEVAGSLELTAFGIPDVEELDKDDLVLGFEHYLFYERKYLLCVVAMSLILWKVHETAEEIEEDRQQVLHVLEDTSVPPGIVRNLQTLNMVQIAARRVQNMTKLLQRLELHGDFKEFLRFWKRSAYELMSEDFQIFNVESFPHDRYSTPEGQRPWDKIPAHMNPSSAVIMSFVRVKERVEDLLENKQVSAAREVVGDALHSEINFRGDHAITKVKLLELFAHVEEMSDNWADAFQRRRDAEELEDSLLLQPSKMKIVKRSLRLARSAEYLGEVSHVQIYVEKVLRLANSAALESNTEVEIEAMKGLSELSFAQTLNGPIAAPLLLIRGAKSAHRVKNSDERLGEWFTSLWTLQSTYGGWWILGPPDQEIQSVVISNLLRIFGLVIPQSGPPEAQDVVLRLLWSFISNNDEEKVHLLFCDLEERVFCAPDVQPGCRLATRNLQFTGIHNLFEFLYQQGIEHLKRLDTEEGRRPFRFPSAPYTATGPDGDTIPRDCVFPTEMMLRLAGYILPWS